MENEDILFIISGLAGILGIKEIWVIIKKKMDISYSIISEKTNYKRNRISELEDELKASNETILQLTIRVAKLEERIIHTAKNRTKSRIEKSKD